MKVPQITYTSGSNLATSTNSIDIPPSAALSISITLPASSSFSRSRKPTAYRAIQRPDGVVVEYPRYFPSTTTHPPSSSSSANSSLQSAFEPQPTTFAYANTTKQSSLLKRARRAQRRCGEEEIKMCGRGGYNGPREMKKEELEDVRMRRFLEEEGPWCGIRVEG